jgi:hypothetical protein
MTGGTFHAVVPPILMLGGVLLAIVGVVSLLRFYYRLIRSDLERVTTEPVRPSSGD